MTRLSRSGERHVGLGLLTVGLLATLVSACGGGSSTLTAAKMRQWVQVASGHTSSPDNPNNGYCISLTTADLNTIYKATTVPGEARPALAPNNGSQLDCDWQWSDNRGATLEVNTDQSAYPLGASGYFMHYMADRGPNGRYTIDPKTVQQMVLNNLANNTPPTTKSQLANYSEGGQ